MHIFVSAGEPSGDLHGSNLVRALRRAEPTARLSGFGGDRMEAAGCDLVYPLCRHAVMGFARVFREIGTFGRLLLRADDVFRRQRPDAVVLIDYPGFHWWLARVAKLHGIPVVYFVPPQLWAWAGWRVRKMRRYVDHVLCSLPFEEPWYRTRGVAAEYIGHPYFDELKSQQVDADFVAALQAGGPVVGLLPGSRWQELEHNLDTLVGAARRVHTARPEVRFHVACLKEEHRAWVASRLPTDLPIEVHSGRTTEVIRAARACVAVSGSVGLELLYHGKPSIIVYRTSRPMLALAGLLKTCRYISLVNLLADEELFPEFLSHQDESAAVAGHLLRWLGDEAAYRSTCARLATLRAEVAMPGACERAAAFLRALVHGTASEGQQRLRAG